MFQRRIHLSQSRHAHWITLEMQIWICAVHDATRLLLKTLHVFLWNHVRIDMVRISFFYYCTMYAVFVFRNYNMQPPFWSILIGVFIYNACCLKTRLLFYYSFFSNIINTFRKGRADSFWTEWAWKQNLDAHSIAMQALALTQPRTHSAKARCPRSFWNALKREVTCVSAAPLKAM